LILCECGKFINRDIFRDYIKTSVSPSTSTIGHTECGLIFNLVDVALPKRYSSKKELKSIARKFAEKEGVSDLLTQKLLLEVDRLKRGGKLSDYDILVRAIRVLR